MKYLLICFILIISLACKEKVEKLKYLGIDIKNKYDIYNDEDNDSLSYEIFLLNTETLDGFWDSYAYNGERSRTQLYLNGKVDTTWFYYDMHPTTLEITENEENYRHVYLDTTELYAYIRNKVGNYNPKLSPNFEYNIENDLFGLDFERSYTTYNRFDGLDRKLLLFGTYNLDGIWLDYEYQKEVHMSKLILGNSISQRNYWSSGRFIEFHLSSDSTYEFSTLVEAVDSIKIVESIYKKKNKFHE